MSTAQSDTNVCYRHPDRRSFILCQRCGRTICPQCQTAAPVGYHCPECVAEARASAPRTRPAVLTRMRRAGSSGAPVATYSLIGVTAAVYLLQLVTGGLVTSLLLYQPIITSREPWTMLTSAFVHASPLHILFNMLMLWVFGRILEPLLGRGRFLALYLISALGGSVAVLLLNPTGGVLGASGAVFGLMGALLVLQRTLGSNSRQLLILIVLNLAIGFFISNVSWQAHVGGVVVGAAIGFVISRTRGIRQQRMQLLLIGSVAAALVVITVAALATFGILR